MKHFFLILFSLLVVNCTLLAGEINAQGRSTVEFDIRQELKERMNLFKEAIRHIRQNNSDELRRMGDDVEEAISFFDSWQQTRRSIARGIRARTAQGEEINQLAGEFLESVTDAESAQYELSMGWPLFVEKQQKGNQFAKKIEEFIDAHRLLFKRADAMYHNRSAVSLPTMVGLYGPPPQIALADSKRCGIEFVVENNGISSLNEIKFRIETTAGETVQNMWIEPDQITTVSPGKAVKIKLCTSGSSVAENLVRLLIESEEINKVEMLRITEQQ